jgi:hypothetical protein
MKNLLGYCNAIAYFLIGVSMSAESFLYDDCRIWEGTNKDWFRDILEEFIRNSIVDYSDTKEMYRIISSHMEEHSTNLEEVLDALFEVEKRRELLYYHAEENLQRYKAALLNINVINSVDIDEFDGMPMLSLYTDLPIDIHPNMITELEETVESIIGQDIDYQIIYREQGINH